ncbi:unnamed protein product, partial [Owenia fusiformis]
NKVLNNKCFRMLLFCIIAFATLATIEAGPRANQSNWTPLDDYVYREDDYFDYDPIEYRPGLISNVHVLNLTSQRWKNESVTNQSIWTHPLSIFLPHDLQFPDACLLFIHVGDIGDPIPDEDNDDFYTLVGLFAELTGAPVAYLRNVPNQPMGFVDDSRQWNRREDSIIAYTWKKFIIDNNATDPEIIIFFPMVKAAVRAMDAVQEYAFRVDPRTAITKFIPAGGSKRGWTAWLTAAVDDRVVGVAPFVFTLLNLRDVLRNQHRSLNGWTWAFRDYFWEGLTAELDNPNTQILADLIDPMSFNDRFETVPKYIVSAAKDEFFMLDGTRFFFDQLKGPKLFWMAENAPHWLEGKYVELAENTAAFFTTVINNNPLPNNNWTFAVNEATRIGTITFSTDTAPRAVNVWVAEPIIGSEVGNRRDFRWQHLVPGYVPPPGTDITGNDNGIITYEATLGYPDAAENEVYTAFFIEASFATPDLDEYQISTEVHILPNTWPIDSCSGEGCRGQLV